MLLCSVIILFGVLLLCGYRWTYSSIHYPMTQPIESFYTLQANTLNGDAYNFDALRGKRILIVNTASKCGYTPQYKDLETLYQEYGGENFEILGFPCNDFGKQEQGSADEIALFCSENYGVSFPMMEKVHLKGADQHGVYAWLCSEELNGVGNHKVGWNFHKFLIDESGSLVASHRSGVGPLNDAIVQVASGKQP